MMRNTLALRVLISASVLALIALAGSPISHSAAAQTQATLPNTTAGDAGDDYFKDIYRDFYLSYKLGPGDTIAIRVLNQPDYSLEQVKVSPVGRIYQPLIGEIDVVGLTVPELDQRLTTMLREYIINPEVTISLLEANSAKIGVIGDVRYPGILVMTRPLTLLDAINERGGVTDYGNKSNITIVRQARDGRMQIIKANLKLVLEGKANPEENITLQAGDTVVVHGNFKKKFAQITSLAGFGYFLTVIADRAK